MNWDVRGTGTWKGDLQLGFALFLILMVFDVALVTSIYLVVEAIR